MSPEQEDRLVLAFESIAKSLLRSVDAKYPERKEPTDATVTRIPTDEDRAREHFVEPAESLEEEEEISPRMRRFMGS